jgi:cytidylate kinase
MFLYLGSKAMVMIITISGKPGSGKGTVAKIIAERLNLKHYSIGDFMRDIAKEKGVSLLELGKTAEKERWVDDELDKRQIELGKKEDGFVIDSRLGFYFIPKSVKVFLDVNLNESAKRIFNAKRKDEKDNLNLKKTKDNIKKRMKSEMLRYKKYYGLNYYDKKHYDFVVDTSGVSIDKVVGTVVEWLKKKINLS